MFKAWTIINNLLSSYTYGHVLWETRLLVEELQRRGTETRLLGHRSIKAEDFPAARTIPMFELHYAQAISEDREWGYLENFVVHNLAYEKTLRRTDPSLFSDSLTLIPDIGERQLLAALRWLDGFDASSRPRIVMILRGQADWSAANPSLETYARIWASCPEAVRRHVKLCTRSNMSAGKYKQILGTRPNVIPSPLGPTEREVEAVEARIGSRKESLIVSFLAGARLERGAAIIPEVVKQCVPFGVRFLVQLTDPIGAGADLLDELRSLRAYPEVQFHDGLLSRKDYNDWIAQSVVLLPYEAARYQSRSSGVYLEAKCFGAPVIVPAGTWMAEEVARLGNGLVFEDYSAAAIARCIANAQQDLTALRERAASCARDYRLRHGADRCVDAIEALFDRR